MAIVAILLRVAVFFTASTTGHLSLATYTAKGDGASYLAYAAAMSGERSFHSLAEYDRRVFPGYPALIAIVHRLGFPLPVAALLVTWASAGFAAAAAAWWFADRRIGYALLCLIPHYLINSSMAMSEASLLAAVLAGLLLAQREKNVSAGILLGFAGLIRPMACFAVAGVLLLKIMQRRWKSAAILTAVTLGALMAGIAALQLWTGDALQGTRIYANNPGAYGGHMILWPFQSLLTTPFHEKTSIGRIFYTWIHVAITLSACALLVRRTIQTRAAHATRAARDVVALPWLLGNTLFVLCIGSAWGFRHFPRFTIPTAPAMFWTLRSWLPSNRILWMLIVLACFVAAIFGVRSSP